VVYAVAMFMEFPAQVDPNSVAPGVQVHSYDMAIRIPDPRLKVALIAGGAVICGAALWEVLRNYNARAARRIGKPRRNVMLKWKFEQEKLAGVDVEEMMGREPL